jgi:hypothetical protein
VEIIPHPFLFLCFAFYLSVLGGIGTGLLIPGGKGIGFGSIIFSTGCGADGEVVGEGVTEGGRGTGEGAGGTTEGTAGFPGDAGGRGMAAGMGPLRGTGLGMSGNFSAPSFAGFDSTGWAQAS